MSIMKNVFTTHFIRKSTIVGALLAVTACAGGPRTVNASLPLVTSSLEKPNKKTVPKQYWPMLADQNQSLLIHNQYKITLGDIYPSALGVRCRELVFEEKNQVINKRVACENNFLNENNKVDTGWFLEKEIIESSRYVEM